MDALDELIAVSNTILVGMQDNGMTVISDLTTGSRVILNPDEVAVLIPVLQKLLEQLQKGK